jgi:sugar lactone lactonase YvrE
MVRIQTGNSAFRVWVEEGWAKLPAEYSFGYTHGIVVDAQDNVYILHTKAPNLMVFNKAGEWLRACQIEGIAAGAHGLYLHNEQDGEFLYMTDTGLGTVVKTTLDGEVVLRLELPDMPEVYNSEKLYKPTDMAVAANGDIYVSDGYGQSWIHQYSAEGKHIRSWGGKGKEPGQMACPHGISVKPTDDGEELYVADRGNHRIQVFTPDGVHKRFIDQDMDMPCNFYFHGGLMFFPDLHSRVTIFDASNDLLVAHLGEDQLAYKQEGWPNLPKTYYRPNRFSSPHGVCVDSHGDVYVAEWIIDGRITKLIRS